MQRGAAGQSPQEHRSAASQHGGKVLFRGFISFGVASSPAPHMSLNGCAAGLAKPDSKLMQSSLHLVERSGGTICMAVYDEH